MYNLKLSNLRKERVVCYEWKIRSNSWRKTCFMNLKHEWNETRSNEENFFFKKTSVKKYEDCCDTLGQEILNQFLLLIAKRLQIYADTSELLDIVSPYVLKYALKCFSYISPSTLGSVTFFIQSIFIHNKIIRS